MNNLFDIQPQCTDIKYGPEPSIKQVVYKFYVDSGFSRQESEEYTKEYLAKIWELWGK